MCGRFGLTAQIDLVRKKFRVKGEHAIPARYNIAPSMPILAVRYPDVEGSVPSAEAIAANRHSASGSGAGKGETLNRHLAAMQWNFVPEWAKALPEKPLINARVETIEAKPSFRASVKRRRCLVPFTGWYEWKTERGVKQPYYITPRTEIDGAGGNNDSESVQAFAAIWSVWHGPGGDHWLESVAIVTAPATGHLQQVHHRKPLVVQEKDYDRWMWPHDPLPRNFLQSFDWRAEDSFDFYPVTTQVGNPRFDNPDCIKEHKYIPPQPDLFGGL